MPPCILFEDEHLLVVHKPAGLNTHAPSPCAGEGIYDWLRNREPRWAKLAIMHRLDKQTSGVLAFGLTPAANRSLTAQFAERQVRKTYLLLTDRLDASIPGHYKSCIVKAGDRFLNRPWDKKGTVAETEFEEVPRDEAARLLPGGLPPGTRMIRAHPLTGRTHQIRVHAAACGFPVLGDDLYDGTRADRLYLHACQLQLTHPVSGEALSFTADWPRGSAHSELRRALIDPEETDSFRLLHGEADFPGVYVDKLGRHLLVQSEAPPSADLRQLLEALAEEHRAAGVYWKLLTRHTRGKGLEASPSLLFGEAAPERFEIRENGLKYELSFQEGYSVGLFLDQRENRRRFLTRHVAHDFPKLETTTGAPLEVLNTFAYTCGFSVAAAKGGARTTSLDLSKKYLEWGRRNLELNGIAPAEHDFIYGDVFDWLKRFTRKQRSFDVIVLDPPTFSQSREQGVFRAQKDYGALLAAALPLLRPNGVLLASSNAARWAPEEFLATLRATVQKAGRSLVSLHYAPQPPDFPVGRENPAYLKTAWVRVGGKSVRFVAQISKPAVSQASKPAGRT